MKKIFPLLAIVFLMAQSLSAQEDSTSYDKRPFQFTFLFPPLSTNGAKNAHIVNDVSLNLLLGVSGGVEKFEAAGFINIDKYYMNGVQLAGFGNTVGGHVSGAQIAGFYNVNGSHTSGFQGAGFVNVAEEVEGAQVAGFVNVAGTVKGFQGAGFLNICDSIDGVPLAFISVVKKNGYRKFGFNISEVQYANFSYKMGVGKLYNIYSFGKPFGPGSRWMFGAGLGTEMKLSGNMNLNIEGTVHQELWIADPATTHFLYIDRLNLYNTVKVLFGWNMGDKVDLHIGPTFNVSVAHTSPSLGVKPWNQIAPYAFYSHTNNSYKETRVQMWVGLQGSISF
jgi:hypothetical protein